MYIWSQRIHVGISACLYGSKVRYNGKGWDMVKHIGRDSEMFIFHPLCPEVMSGMGVPRPSIHLTGQSGHEVWQENAKVVSNRNHGPGHEDKQDWTLPLIDACHHVESLIDKRQIKVYIYMEGSPTCGVHRTTLKNKRLGKPPGVLGAKLLEKRLFLIDGIDLQSPIKWWDIKRRLLAFLYLDQLEMHTKADVFQMWHHYKFICQEISEVQARALGHRLATLDEGLSHTLIEEIRLEVMDILRKPSTSAKIRQMLWKHYSYLRKHKDIQLEAIQTPQDIRGMQKLAKELQIMTLASYDANVVYGQVPVLFRR